MFKFVVQFLFLLILLLRNRKAKGGWLTPSGVLIMIYAVCSLMGIIVVWSGEYRSPLRSYYWTPMLVFDLFILLYLLPFRRFNEMRINMLRLPSRQFLDIFSTIIIILSFYAIIYYASTVRFIFSLGDLGAARDIRYLEGEFVETGLFNTIASVSSANYVFAIVLYFIYKTFDNSKTRCRLLFISSFSNAIHVLSFVGRDGIVFWLFTFVFCWAFFSPYLQIDTRKKIRKIFTIGGAVLFIPFFMISISRFAGSTEIATGGTTGSIISYMGQSFVQGPLFFGLDSKPIDPGASFPLLQRFFDANPNAGRMILGEWVSWKFSTFIVSLYISLDLWGLIAFTFIMLTLFAIIFRRLNSVINLGQYTIYLLYFQIISQGVFYFCHYTRGGNLFILTTLVLSIIFSMASKQRDSLVLKK